MTRSVPLPTEPTDTHVGSAAGRGAPGRVAEVHAQTRRGLIVAAGFAVAAVLSMVARAGWWMPLDYGSALAEPAVVRKAAGMFDLSHMGEIEVRGPWVTTSYYKDPAEDKFHDGWLRTGDVGTIDSRGFIRISDRAKDVVKSGGEWISSLDLERALLEHPDVREVAVIAAPDQRWGERPLACVALKEGSTATPEELRDFLKGKVAKWWLPDLWSYIENVPRTSVGKYDKKLLRTQLADGALDVKSGGPSKA